MRIVRIIVLSAAFLGLALAASTVSAQGGGPWATVKGQVLFPDGVAVPARAALNVGQDKEHCLGKGAILDESIIVNPKNRGIKNVVVWLRPDDDKNAKTSFTPNQINPADKARKPEEVVIDQPCCMFVNRITTARVGDTIVVKNSAPVAHNFFWASGNNAEFNQTVPSKGQWKMPQALVAESAPIQFKCTIHTWMDGYVRIFDHPYFAVTDDNGNFDIKNAPVGKFRIVYWHEKVGYLNGKLGRFGAPIDIVAPATQLKPVDFNVTPAQVSGEVLVLLDRSASEEALL